MPDDFEPLRSATALIAGCRHAALATLDDDLTPFASLVSVAAGDGRFPVLLLSDLALHTRNIRERGRASLLLSDEPGDTGEDPLVRERLTICGRMEQSDDQLRAADIFLRRHPYAAGYSGFGDFSYFQLVCERAHLVAGFGRIAGLSAEDLFPGEFR